MAMIRDGNGNVIDAENPLYVTVAGGTLEGGGGGGAITADSILPVDIQARYMQTIQTHNGVTAPINGVNSDSAFIDTEGFDKVTILMNSSNGATGDTEIRLVWSIDGVAETVVTGCTMADVLTHDKKLSAETPTRARYLKVRFRNLNATTPATMSGWAYLKV